MASKSIGVAIVEQLGALLAMAAYLVAVQHIMVTSVLHHPEESWVLKLRAWWRTKQEELERESLRVWTLDPVSDEPKVNPARED